MKTTLFMLMLSGVLLVSCTQTRSFTVQGKAVIGHEVCYFRSCGDTLDYWLADTTYQLDSLYKATVGDNAKPYTSVYAKLKVKKVDKPTDGFAADYDGMYEVIEIIEMEPML